MAIMRPLSLSRAIPYLLGAAVASSLLLIVPSLFRPATQEVICPPGANAARGRHLRNALCPCGQEPAKSQAEMMDLMRMLIRKLNASLDVHVTQSGGKNLVVPPAGSVGNRELIAGNGESLLPQPDDVDVTSFFRTVVTPAQKNALYVALLKLSQVSMRQGYTWMLYSGTLLGSFRHHDMVPWDDDFDIFMNYTQRQRIVVSLSNLRPNFYLFEAGSRLKFWSSNGTTQSSKYPWKWPYLDISFYKENATHIWDGSMEDDYGDRLYLYRKTIVFPLHLRPMGSYFFPAPRDSYKHLQLTYKSGGLGMCWTTHYSHKNEALITHGVHTIMCEDLRHMYPFVHRSLSDNGVLETLMFDGKEIHHVVVDEPKYAITDAYAVQLIT